MKIKQIRNATLIIDYADMRFLVDPWLQDRGTGDSFLTSDPAKNKVHGPTVDLPCTIESLLDGVNACIVTHTHSDHFTPDRLPKDMLYIVQNVEDELLLHNMGLLNTKCLDTEEITFGDLSITKTEGKHGTNAVTARALGCVSGVIFAHPQEKKLYITGDTVYCSCVHKVLTKDKPDVIVVNACAARVKSLGRILMNVQDVQKVRKDAENAYIVISHMEAVNHAYLTRKDYEELKDRTGDRRILIPSDGSTISL